MLDGVVNYDAATKAVQSYDAEQAFLCCLLANNNLYHRFHFRLPPEAFFDGLNRKIYEISCSYIKEGKSIDPVTVIEAISTDNINTREYIANYIKDLTDWGINLIGGIDCSEDYFSILINKHEKRMILDQCDKIKEEILGDDLDTKSVIKNAMNGFISLTNSKISSVTKHDAIDMVISDLETEPVINSSGIDGLDDLLGGGFFAGKLYGIAARKKAGKTALMGTISYNMNMANVPHLFVAMEMTAKEIEARNISRTLNKMPLQILLGKRAKFPIHPEEVRRAKNSIPNCMLYETRPGISLEELETIILSYINEYGISGVFVDYLQLVTGKNNKETEEHHLRNVAQSLANICKSLNIWIIVAAQLNQEGNARGGEGIRLAADAYLTINRETGQDTAWIELQDCRYMPYGKLGDEMIPGLRLDPHGPFFVKP